MVAVKTGFTPPPMPGMPAPMQPMGGLPPMPPMGGPGTFPVPQGGNPFAPLPPMPLAGSPPPMGGPGTFPVAPNTQVPQQQQQQQGSNAPRRKRFGDSLESMLGRNQGLGATAPQQRPPQMMPQQRMVAPGTPMMRTPPMGRGMPRPMREGGIVQYMSGGGVDAATANAYIQNMVAGRSDLTAAEKLEFANSLASSMGVQGGSGVQSAIDNLAGLEVSPVAQNNNASASVAESYDNYPDNYNYLGGNTYDADANTYTTADGTVISPVANAVNQTGYMDDADLVTLGGMQKYNDDATVAAVMNQLSDSGSLDNFLALNEAAGTDLTNVNTVLSGMNTNTTTTNNGTTGTIGTTGTTGTTDANNFMRTDVIAPYSLGNVALFGPNIADTASYSQFVQDPKTFKVTAPDGPTMTAVSPIGSIDLPAAPVDLNIGNYLTEPVFGSMSPVEKNMGGIVPRQTSIAGQPHMLAYINPEEQGILQDYRQDAPTVAGPGGIPSYYYGQGMASTANNSIFQSSSSTSSNSNKNNNNNSSSSGKMDFGDDEDFTPTSDELDKQISAGGGTNITTNFSEVDYDTTGSGSDYDTAAQADTDVSGAEFVALGGLGSGDSGTPTNIAPISLGSDDPVVFTDIMGKTYSNAADRDRANLGYQQASYQQGSQALRGTLQGFKQFGDFDSDEEAYRRGAANFAADPPKGTDLSYYNLQNTPDIFTDMFNQPILPPKIGSGDDDDKDDSDQDKASKYNNMLALENEFAPAEGGYSLVDLKERISLAEGTSDKDGYKRLLGGQETNRFKIDPTKMTVQEILNFQKNRDKGSYSEYSQGVNKDLGNVDKDGKGLISTPVGKYQIVGSTLQGLVNAGVLDPDELFNENAQERAATNLITQNLFTVDPDTGKKTYNIGLKDLKTGDLTEAEFKEALKNQFDGLTQEDLNDLIKKADEGDASDIQLESGPAQEIDVLDPDNKEELKSLKVDDESGKTVSNQDKEKDKNKELPPFIPAEKVEQITEYTDKDGKTTVDNPKTPQNEAVIAQLGLGSSLADVTATGRDIGVPNAAESAFLMEALNEMEFDDKGNLVGAEPNFLEETMGKIIKNLTLGAFDPNDPQKGEDAKAILDAYQKTGKFVYDGKEMSLTELIKASKEEGIEPAVIGVEGADGSTVGFDDGTGFRNIMGDYNPVYKDGQVFSGGSDTQNILTGDTDVFGGNTNTNNTATKITTSGGDDTTTTDGPDLGHTVDENGNKVCNTEGYIYNPETKICEKKKVEEDDKDLSINVMRGEDFDDVLGRVTTAAPNIGSIAGNVQNMQEGGMAGLNRAADNFLQALAG